MKNVTIINALAACLFISTTTASSLQADTQQRPKFTLTLKHQKNSDGALKKDFFQEFIQMFGIDIFIETGTYLGDTTNNAQPYFREIHTIELAKHLHTRAVERFASKKNIHVHLGDSSEVLPMLLPQVQGKILFWLDGHYSESNDAKGKTNTPIIDELLVIKESGIKNAIILIDDMRCFQEFENNNINHSLLGYPTVSQLHKTILAINPDYIFGIMGDTAIAFLKSEPVVLSPVIQACTTSRLFEEDENTDYTSLMKAEQIIGQAIGEEKETLLQLPERFIHSENRHKTGRHYRLWKGLILNNERRSLEAQQEFFKASQLGLSIFRIKSYIESN